VIATDRRDEDSTGTVVSVASSEVLPPVRDSSLVTILGLLFAVQAVGLGLSFLFGRRLFGGLASTMTTKRTILLSLIVYSVIAVWGFLLNAVVEFWFIAWMVAVVQGGSQALSRSLYAGMSPSRLSGEFFGFFSIMEKFSSIIGPLLFAGAVAAFGTSRPAVLSVIAFFIVGGWLLNGVVVEEGRRVADEEDARLLGEAGPGDGGAAT
jgi:UMF1 family MFS transporter